MGNETKWTPGTWVKSPHADLGDGVEVKDSRGVPVCRCMIASVFDGGPVKTTTQEQRNANAHLIAAAPELYEALGWAMRFVEQVRAESPAPKGGGEDIAYRDAKAALAKARGEQS